MDAKDDGDVVVTETVVLERMDAEGRLLERRTYVDGELVRVEKADECR